MIYFFRLPSDPSLVAVDAAGELSGESLDRLSWLFGGAGCVQHHHLQGRFRGPRREMVTPWSTNAVEITQIMGIGGIRRIEEFTRLSQEDTHFDPMLQAVYEGLGQNLFDIHHQPEPLMLISDIRAYNESEGLALSNEEIEYLEDLSRQLERQLTDSEVFGFSQVNSEHCRHKIFNAQFIIDGTARPHSLFELIKKTTRTNPGKVVSAYKDNVAFISGPDIVQFAPALPHLPACFALSQIPSVISLKAETHNFPTTVEPFNGAATGSGGEIRDRMAGGRGSLPLAGTAVYMTAFSRTEPGRHWENAFPERKWLYQRPDEILIKASNGASDFGNKFGQPLICGSVLTFELIHQQTAWGYDKVIMLAGGVGFANADHAIKGHPAPGDKIIVMGGDNYRIGMGGGAVSSVATGQFANNIELNAVQRSNPEMQKRVANAIRALCERTDNPVVSIHDHGAGGHLNSLSELVEEQGGTIDIDKLPLGDPTLSDKEIMGNESQERMGLVMSAEGLELLRETALRERAPLYVAGEVTGDHHFRVQNPKTGQSPINLKLSDFFGNPPRLIIHDKAQAKHFTPLTYDIDKLRYYLEAVLQCEAVACKDWLTNKVDRSVSGRIAHQQTAGPLQLPLNNLGVVALDYEGKAGIATAIGHAPVSGLIHPGAASRLSVAEALTNLVWAPLTHGLTGISLSANWMWPCHNPGENARLYEAVEAISDFAIALGINIPTGKDSLSMTQKYPDGTHVLAPGTVIVSSVAEVSDITKTVGPVLHDSFPSSLIYIDFSESDFHLGGSSFAQVLNQLGDKVPDVANPEIVKNAFKAVQELIQCNLVLAGHDISSGGLITSLLEMLFSRPGIGLRLNLNGPGEPDLLRLLFSEKPSVIVQTDDADKVSGILRKYGVRYYLLGEVVSERKLDIVHLSQTIVFDPDALRDTWFRTSYLLDSRQSGEANARERFMNHAKTIRHFNFPEQFDGSLGTRGLSHRRNTAGNARAAIIREKGSNGDREMAYSLWLAGFDVKDVHMTDLVSGRETLEDVSMIAFVGGFSNSDVLGSAKGWAGAFMYNEKARQSLEKFYARTDTLSLGVCNGCQLMAELGLVYPEHTHNFRLLHNDTRKYESSFLTVKIPENHSVMLANLAGCELGIWVAHGEGKFSFPYPEENYHIAARYAYSHFPGNPNGSMFDTAAVASADGRHLAIMPHLERAIFPWQWGYYPENRRQDEISPWLLAFINARNWVEAQNRAK